MLSPRIHGLLAAALMASLLTACGGGHGATAPPIPGGSSGGSTSSSASVTFVLNTAGAPQTQALPKVGAFGGQITVQPTAAPPGTTLTLTGSTTAPATFVKPQSLRQQQDQAVSVFYYLTMVASNTVTMTLQPAIALAVSPDILVPGRSYYYATSNPTSTDPDTQLHFDARSGTADTTTNTITFPPSNQPLTLVAGQQYVITFYATADTSGQLSANIQQQIDTLITGHITNGDAPGIQVGIAQNGRILSVKGYGNARLPSTAVTPQTTFEIGSVSKQFCATLVLLLQQRGLLNIDAPLSTYIPEYNQASKFTLRDMMNMVSGVPADVDLWYGTNFFTFVPQATVLSNLNTVPLDFPPRLQYEYSNGAYWLLGVVVERVTKMPYADALQQNVLTPLGLTSTYFFGTRSDPNFAQGYTRDTDGTFKPQTPWSTGYTFSEGSLVSNVGDLLAWDYGLRSGVLLTPSSLSTEFAVPNLGAVQTSYAMGWVQENNPSLTWHNGEVAGFHSMNAVYNASGYAIVVLGNTWTTGNGCGRYCPEELASQIYGILTGASVTPPPPRSPG